MSNYLDEVGLKQLWDKIPHRRFISASEGGTNYHLNYAVSYLYMISGRRIITGNGTNIITFMTIDELKSDIPLLYSKYLETSGLSLWCSLSSSGPSSEAYVIATLIDSEKISAIFNKSTYNGGLYDVRALITV